MAKHFYRFRPIDALLDRFHELENQEIYFASPAELNDPMEGFRDIFWQGDHIAWKNLFRHYLRCLTRACALWYICGKEHSFDWDQIPILDPRLPTDIPAALLDEQIDTAFFCGEADRYFDALSARTTPVRRDELCAYIQVVHPFAVTTILSCYERAGLTPASTITPEFHENLKNTFPKAQELVHAAESALSFQNKSDEVLIALFAALRHSKSQLSFINQYNNDIDCNRAFILVSFPDEYVDRLDAVLYPEWYAACFLPDCRDSALWAHYGDNHSGVCLKFKAAVDSGRPSLDLERLCSVTNDGPTSGSATHEFIPVTYRNSHVTIDFFRSLGRLSIRTLDDIWFSNKNGERSVCAADIFENEEDWRKRYWSAFESGVTTKLRDWEREQEHRLILHSSIIDFCDQTTRKVKYRFESLDGIIFGMNTPVNRKVEICKIIEAKCRAENRTDFKFYQAYFSPLKGCIEHAEMNFLKFKTS